jgi:hypothetical protein
MTPIGRVKIQGLIFKKGTEICVIVNISEPGYTRIVRISEVVHYLAGNGKKKFPSHRWNDATRIETNVCPKGRGFCTRFKGVYLEIARRFQIRQFQTLEPAG